MEGVTPWEVVCTKGNNYHYKPDDGYVVGILYCSPREALQSVTDCCLLVLTFPLLHYKSPLVREAWVWSSSITQCICYKWHPNKGFRTVESNRVVHQKYSDYANTQEAVLLVGKTSEWWALERKQGKFGQIEKCSQFQVKSSKQLLGNGASSGWNATAIGLRAIKDI